MSDGLIVAMIDVDNITHLSKGALDASCWKKYVRYFPVVI